MYDDSLIYDHSKLQTPNWELKSATKAAFVLKIYTPNIKWLK